MLGNRVRLLAQVSGQAGRFGGNCWFETALLVWDPQGHTRNASHAGVSDRAGWGEGGRGAVPGCQRLWVAGKPPQIPTSVWCYLSPPPRSSAAREPGGGGAAKSGFLPPPRDGAALGCRDGPAGDAASRWTQGPAAAGFGNRCFISPCYPVVVRAQAGTNPSSAGSPHPWGGTGSGSGGGSKQRWDGHGSSRCCGRMLCPSRCCRRMLCLSRYHGRMLSLSWCCGKMLC